MPEVADLYASLKGKDTLTSMLATAEGRLKSLGSSTKNTLENVGLGIGAATVALAAYSVKSAADFEELETALVTGAGESSKNLAMVSAGILQMAGQVGESADSLSQGMYYVESAGYHGAAGLQVLQASAEGAKIGLTDAQSVAEGLTTELRDYGQSASMAAGVTGQMIAAVSAGKQTMQQFSSTLSTILPTAAAMHVSFQQIAAAEATMTERGVPADQAATALRSAMQQLLAPSSTAKEAMLQLGLNMNQMRSSLVSGNLTGVLHMFAQAEERAGKAGMSQANVLRDLGLAFGGIKGQAVALNLIPDLSGYLANVQAIGTVQQGATKETRSWGLVQKDLNQQLSEFQAGLQAAAIQLGTGLLPQVSTFVTSELIPAVQWTEKWTSQHQTLTQGMLKVGVAIGGLALMEKFVSPLASGFSFLGKIIGLGGKVKDLIGGTGGAAGMSTPLMNVTADVVNINGPAAAAGEAESGVAAAASTAGMGAAATVAITAGAVAALGMFVTSGVGNQFTPAGRGAESDFIRKQEQAYDAMKGKDWMTLPPALAQQDITGWAQQYAVNIARGSSPAATGIPPVTVNLQPGSVVVHGGGVDKTDLENHVRQLLTEGMTDYTAQLLHAQKSLRGTASTRLPGAAGVSR